jgi:MFS family permease
MALAPVLAPVAGGLLHAVFGWRSVFYTLTACGLSGITMLKKYFEGVAIRDKPIAPGSPWQNGCAERLIGTIRRECLDHLMVFGEAHLRRILRQYAAYYNGLRTHRALNQDAPVHRAVQSVGAVTSRPVLGGLHHQYCRI